MRYDRARGVRTATVPLDPNATHVDFFSNHRKTIRYGNRAYRTYISSPYARIELSD